MRIIIIIWISIYCILFSSQADHIPQPLPKTTLEKIEQKLNHIKTLKARFIQTDNAHKILSGNFYLSRPVKIRFEYDSPAPYLIVGDGKSLVYDDYLTQQATFFSSESILPPLLSKQNIVLDTDVKILKSWETTHAFFLLVENELGGQILFEFDSNHALKGWTTHDIYGQKVKISLLRTEANIPLAEELFIYRRSPRPQKHTHLQS